MAKILWAVALVVCLSSSQASGQSILQKSDWRERKLESYLPPPGPAVPWLDLDTKTRLPKGDIPLGRAAASAGHFVLPAIGPEARMSSNAGAPIRSM
jgi:hypothetical protein